jgi:hypothetical protein
MLHSANKPLLISGAFDMLCVANKQVFSAFYKVGGSLQLPQRMAGEM